MNVKSVLRITVVAVWLFAVAGIVLSSLLEGALPAQLQEYRRWNAGRDVQVADILLFAGGGMILLAAVVSAVGLLCLQRWARWLHLGAVVSAFVWLPFAGPTVEHGLADTFYEVGGTLTGVVLAITFFTDALGKRSAEPCAGGNAAPPRASA